MSMNNFSFEVFNGYISKLGEISFSLGLLDSSPDLGLNGTLKIFENQFSFEKLFVDKKNQLIHFFLNTSEALLPAILSYSQLDQYIIFDIYRERIEFVTTSNGISEIKNFMDSSVLYNKEVDKNSFLEFDTQNFLAEISNNESKIISKRRLTEGEIEFLKNYFLETIDYSRIKIRQKSILSIFNRHRAVTIGRNIHFGKETYHSDYSQILNNYSLTALLIHEVCHVWQLENLDYWWFKAMIELIKYGDAAYDYDIYNLKEKLTDYRFEQQGSIMQDYRRLEGSVWGDKLATVIFNSIGTLSF
tara:strand:- start:357 stop:1262 length:906 start_codon:yes stop_codon:yes gene_type:complete